MYYILKCFGPPKSYIARIEYQDDDAFRFWNTGERFETEPTTPLQARVLTDNQTVYAEFWDTPIPLMTKRLYKALVSAGINNLDIYPAILTDSRTGVTIQDYVAFNIIGAIAAVNLTATKFALGSVKNTSSDIDLLVIDANKAQGTLLFRLAEAVHVILVHESVKKTIEATNINTLSFLKTDQVVL